LRAGRIEGARRSGTTTPSVSPTPRGLGLCGAIDAHRCAHERADGREGRQRIDHHDLAIAAEERERALREEALAGLERDRVSEAHLDAERTTERLEHRHAGQRAQERDDARRGVLDLEDVQAPRALVEGARGGPLGQGHAGLGAPAEEIADQRVSDADLGRGEEARGARSLRRRQAVGRELEDEVAERHVALDVVGLAVAVVVHDEVRLGIDDLGDVVAERRDRIAVLHEVPLRAREDVAAREARDRGHAIHAIRRLGREGDDDLARLERGHHALDRERGEDLVERALVAVRAEERDHAIERGEEHDALLPEHHAACVGVHAGRPKPRLVEGRALEERCHGAKVPRCA
jgi:hypothetical protein